ncbi:amidohydrolase family protein [bacterium]|nr:amidohydrolase family protein [bacterium]
MKEVGVFSEAGGQILFGTDVGYIKDYDPTQEYEYMAQAGLSWQKILASLIISPAERFNESKRRGRIAKGMDADLVVLASDPSKNVKAFSQVQYTIRAARIIHKIL